MGVKTYQPAASAVIYKRVPRRSELSGRFRSANRRLDLSELLGEQCSINTSHGVHGGGGRWTITLQEKPDNRDGGIFDSVYGFAEPMDYIEIRMAREPHRYVGQQLPIVMRGFVSDVRRLEVMTPDGQPLRRVVISGEDYGKIPQIVVILSYEDFQSGIAWLTSFPLFFEYGFNPASTTSAQFIQLCVDGILNPYLRDMRGFVQSEDPGAIPLLRYQNGGTGGIVAPYGAPPMNSTVQQFMMQWADTPWNELFIEDQEAGPTVVYRPTPFATADQAQARAPRSVYGGALPRHSFELTEADVIDQFLGRSDSNVANYFWVEAPRSILPLGGLFNATSIAQGNLTMRGYPNNEPSLYGLRLMSAQSNQSGAIGTTQQVEEAQREIQKKTVPPLSKSAGFSDLPNVERSSLDSEVFDWIKGRRDQLRQLNKDNVIWENGTIRVKGDERLRAGRYITIQRGALRSTYYVSQVSHSFVPFGAFITTLQVERGDGFIKRTALQNQPVLAEGKRGPYDV